MATVVYGRSLPTFRKCPDCGQWDFVRAHRCPPHWEVRNIADLDEIETIFAYTPEEAAKIFADIWDEESHIACQGYKITVVVTSDHTEPQQFVISGEMVPEYHVTPTQETDQ